MDKSSRSIKQIAKRFAIISENIRIVPFTSDQAKFVPSIMSVGDKQIVQKVHFVYQNGSIHSNVCRHNFYHIDTLGEVLQSEENGESIERLLQGRKNVESIVVTIVDGHSFKKEMIVYSMSEN